ncbi:MAG TPA: cell division topological specificity factor MinE [Coleofasciculaceae cyanobacterium]
MLFEFLERLFSRSGSNSRQVVKNRLKFVLAHDRPDLTPDVLDAMRKEILAVVARYVELDPEGMEFALETSQRATSLIANLPIRRVLAIESPPLSEANSDSEITETETNSQPMDTITTLPQFDLSDFLQLTEFADAAVVVAQEEVVVEEMQAISQETAESRPMPDFTQPSESPSAQSELPSTATEPNSTESDSCVS